MDAWSEKFRTGVVGEVWDRYGQMNFGQVCSDEFWRGPVT